MSLVLTGGVALAYATGVVGVHRYTVHLRRAAARGYPTLRWLDWDTLLAGVLPAAAERVARVAVPVEGGPTPRVLEREGGPAQVELLAALVSGAPVQTDAFAEAGFSGGEARWLGLLSDLREEPNRVLEELEATPPATPAEAYLREHLALERRVTPVSLELATFATKRRINQSFRMFGEQPALYFARARASALLGFTSAVLDDLARAVYFSRQAPFYLRAVTEMAFIEEARPALMRACLEGLERVSGAGR
jgi:hypothetical protein